MRPKPRTSQRGASHKRPRRQKRTLLSYCKSCRIENVLKHVLRDLRDPVAHTQNPTEKLVSQNCQVHRQQRIRQRYSAAGVKKLETQ